MSSITDIEKRYMEKLLGMGGGYVLDYSDPSYGEFFKRHGSARSTLFSGSINTA